MISDGVLLVTHYPYVEVITANPDAGVMGYSDFKKMWEDNVFQQQI